MDNSRWSFKAGSDRSRDPKEPKKFPNVRECVIRFGVGTPLGAGGGWWWWGGVAGSWSVGCFGVRRGRCLRRRWGWGVDHRGAASLPGCLGVGVRRGVSRDALGAHGGSLIEQDQVSRYVSPRYYFVRSSGSSSLVPRHDEAPATLRGVESDEGCRACRGVVSRQRRRRRDTNPSASRIRRRCGSSHTRRNHEPRASWQPRRWRSRCLRSSER